MQRKWLPIAAVLAFAVLAWLVFEGGWSPDVVAPARDAVPEQDVRSRLAGDSARGVQLAVGDDPTQRVVGPPHGPVEVTVVGAWGDPLPGVQVYAEFDTPPRGHRGNQQEGGVTDAQGRVGFADLPYDNSWHVAVRTGLVSDREQGSSWGRGPEPHKRPDPSVLVDGSRVRLQVHALPLFVRVERGDDGHAVRGAPCLAMPGFHREAHWKSGDVAPLFLHVARGDASSLEIRCELAPDGYVAHDKITAQHVSPVARRLEAVLPLRSEAEIITRPLYDATWRFAAFVDGVGVEAARIGSDAFGRQRIYGVPHVSRASVLIAARTDEGQQPRHAWRTTRFGRVASEPLLVELVQGERTKLIDATRNEMFGDASGLSDAPFKGPPVGGMIGPSPQAPRVDVRVQRADGSPAIGARVGLGGRTAFTNARGLAVLRGVDMANQYLEVWGAGPAYEKVVRVTDAPRQTFLAQVPAAAQIQLDVVDEEGHGVPYVTLDVWQASTLPWSDMGPDDVQRIDRFTDVSGRRLLRNVEADTETTVKASLGQRTGTGKIAVPAGTTKSLRIVLRRPEKGGK